MTGVTEMPTPFREAAMLASQAVDDVYGEAFAYTPMRRAHPDAPFSADPSRAQTAIVAAYHDAHARAGTGGVRTTGVEPGSPGHASLRPQISFAAAAIAYAPKSGDRLVRAATNEIYHVAEVRRDGVSRYLCDVNLMKGPA